MNPSLLPPLFPSICLYLCGKWPSSLASAPHFPCSCRVAAPMDGHLKHKVANMPVFLDGKEVDGDLKLGDGILTVMRNGYAYLGGPKGLLLNPDDELWMGGKFIDPNPKPTSHRLVVLVSSLVAVLSVSAALYWQRG